MSLLAALFSSSVPDHCFISSTRMSIPIKPTVSPEQRPAKQVKKIQKPIVHQNSNVKGSINVSVCPLDSSSTTSFSIKG